MTKILDGKKTAQRIRSQVKKAVDMLYPNPGLAVVLVGENPASKLYVSYKQKACRQVGIRSEKILIPESKDSQKIFQVVDALNHDPKIHGILVQLPLPEKHQKYESQLIDFINPEKDVDCFHPENVGRLYSAKGKLSEDLLMPATPKGVMTLLKEYGVKFEGKRAVVVGRSNLVGKPLAQMLLSENATVTVCHSRTQELKSHTQGADILVAAVGHPEMIKANMIKEGAVVVDVGINRKGKKVVGDVDFEKVKKKASLITPVPGGVGPMTIASLLQNTLIAYKNLKKESDES